MGLLEENIKILVHRMELTQWKPPSVDPALFQLPIMTREDLRNVKMEKGVFTAKTSGSTGEPVSVEKTMSDHLWFVASNIRDFRWRKWDVTKNVAIIKTSATETVYDSWGIPFEIEPVQGKLYSNNYKNISELQAWLDDINPHYINCFPSIFKSLDLSKVTNFIDWKGTGELGGRTYSSEECGIIAIECPDYPEVMHVMENQYIEVDSDGAMIISTLSNPYIRRYKHGDLIELGKCKCGRGLQTITKIHGRVRNMLQLPNGDKKWPLIGSLEYSDFGIKRFRMIQHSFDRLELQIICDPLNDKEEELKQLIKDRLGIDAQVDITYVDDFPNNKFEEFTCKIS